MIPLQFKPDPHRARRGGGRARDRHWHPSVCLPKRAINYDLAESFVDHSTNPLSSDLYKVRFQHSNKQWPNGRFMSYREKLDKDDGNIVEISCTRTFALVPKRKKMVEIQSVAPPSIVPVDPVVQEQKKKQVDRQTHFYANLFGCGKIPRVTIVENEYRWEMPLTETYSEFLRVVSYQSTFVRLLPSRFFIDSILNMSIFGRRRTFPETNRNECDPPA